MSFLLMNLFSPATQAVPQAGSGAAKADAGTGGNSGGGAAFSAMLASAKDRLASPSAATKSAAMLTPQTLEATMTQAIKQPADALALLKDMALSEQQLNDLRAALRDVLDSESFAGDGQTEQAFQELHDHLEVEMADMGETDMVDIEPVVMQLPVVTQAAQAPRGEMLVRIAQFIQSTLSGQGAHGHAKADPSAQAQIAQSSQRTDPLLEVVQASMFPAQAYAAPQAQQIQQAAAEATVTAVGDVASQGIIMAAYVPQQHAMQEGESLDDLPQWVRDIAPATPQKAAHADAGDLYQDMALPEVSLPGSDAADQAAPASNAPVAVAVPVAAPVTAAQQAAKTNAAVAAAVAPAPAQTAQLAANQGTDELPQDTASTDADDANVAPRDGAAPAQAKQAKPAAVGAHAAQNAAHNAAQPRDTLSPLPEKTMQDFKLEVVQGDSATQTYAPTHNDKLAATTAQRAVNASLYTHRAEVVEQVHVAITRASKADMDRITIQLDPADLGRVDVTMDIRRDGTTQLLVTADRRETLDMLQRDARSLERALQDAGVKADAGSMEFNLRQQNSQAGFGQGDPNFHGNQNGAQHADGSSESAQAGDGQTILQPEIISSATYTVNGGLNVIV